MLKEFIKESCRKSRIVAPRVMVCVLNQATKVEKSVIVDGVKSVLEKTPSELVADIIEKGIFMTGEWALLDGLNKLIEENTGVLVEIVSNSVDAVGEGTGQTLKFINKIDCDILGNEITLHRLILIINNTIRPTL